LLLKNCRVIVVRLGAKVKLVVIIDDIKMLSQPKMLKYYAAEYLA